jgi:nucleoside-diphosphate-sugar epimerase
MSSTVLITGASGRLGSALVRSFAQDHHVVQFSIDDPCTPEQRRLGTCIHGCITDVDAVARAMDGVDAVVHCAAIPGPVAPFDQLMKINVLGTFNVLEAAGHHPRVRQVVFLSSIQWHGLHEEHGGLQSPQYLPLDEAHPSLATGYYDTSKVMGEYLCETFVKRFRKPCVALRPGWIITPEAESTFRAVSPPGRPHLNDYVGACDVVDAVRRALDYEPEGGFDAFLLHADDQRSTMPSRELVARYYPSAIVDRDRLGGCDGFAALVDCGRARERLGWQPQFRCAR